MADEFDRDSRFGKRPESRPAPDAAVPDGEESAGAAETKIGELEAELAAKTEEAARNRDLYLREKAESDNFRKRLQRDKTEAIRYGNETLVRDLLPLLDNLELALEHAGLGGNGKSVVEGVEMIVRMFRDLLDRQGVKTIEVTAGEPFDPSVHEASGMEVAPGQVANTVIRQDQKGYRIHDRLLRPARVVVAGGARNDRESTGKDEE